MRLRLTFVLPVQPVIAMPLASSSNPIGLVLHRHTTRRESGLPTVSVLVGPVGAGIATLRQWAVTNNRPFGVGTVTELAGITDLIVRTAIVGGLVAHTYHYLATHVRKPLTELRAAFASMTLHDLDQFFAANDALLPSGDGTRVARCVCKAILVGETPTAARLLGGADPFAVLSGLAALIPSGHEPAIMLSPPALVDGDNWFRAVAAAGVAIATRVPRFPIAIGTSRAEWQSYLSETPETRVKAVIREGAIELPVVGQKEVESLLTRSGATGIPATVQPLIADGVPTTFAAALADAATAPMAATTAEADDAARSAAERFLFEFLELLPATAGRFELNADPGFRFGPRAAEVDLLACELRIAIEIDGYYHFRNADDYRRDREKDWELQRHGFLVIRFLADDILPKLEDVRDRIIAAVTLRTAGSTV